MQQGLQRARVSRERKKWKEDYGERENFISAFPEKWKFRDNKWEKFCGKRARKENKKYY